MCECVSSCLVKRGRMAKIVFTSLLLYLYGALCLCVCVCLLFVCVCLCVCVRVRAYMHACMCSVGMIGAKLVSSMEECSRACAVWPMCRAVCISGVCMPALLASETKTGARFVRPTEQYPQKRAYLVCELIGSSAYISGVYTSLHAQASEVKTVVPALCAPWKSAHELVPV